MLALDVLRSPEAHRRPGVVDRHERHAGELVLPHRLVQGVAVQVRARFPALRVADPEDRVLLERREATGQAPQLATVTDERDDDIGGLATLVPDGDPGRERLELLPLADRRLDAWTHPLGPSRQPFA